MYTFTFIGFGRRPRPEQLIMKEVRLKPLFENTGDSNVESFSGCFFPPPRCEVFEKREDAYRACKLRDGGTCGAVLKELREHRGVECVIGA